MSEENEQPLVSLTTGNLAETKPQEIVKADEFVTYYNEIIEDIRADRKDVDEVIATFKDLVINDGDASTSSKEALVNLMKIKSEMADKKTKVMDLLLRALMRDRSIPGYMIKNEVNFGAKDKKKLFSILDADEEEKK